MPTTAFTLDNAAVIAQSPPTDFSLVGRTARAFTGQSGFDVDFTGTGANVWIYYQSGLIMRMILDGTVSEVDLTALTPNAWNSITLASGLSEAKHTLYVEFAYFDIGTGSAGTGLEITGASPALSLRTGWSTNVYHTVSHESKFQTDGSATLNPGSLLLSGYLTLNGLNQSQMRFNVSAGVTDIWVLAFADSVALPFNYLHAAIDGVDQAIAVSTIVRATRPYFEWIHVLTGLSGAAPAEILLASQRLAVAAVMTVGGTVSSTAPTAKPIWCFFGDSITEALYAGEGNDPCNGFPYAVGLSLGVCPYSLGVSGRTVTIEAGGPTPGEGSTAIASVVATAAEAIVCLLGTNDFGAYVAGTLTSAELRTAYGAMLAGWASGLGTIPIHCFQPTPTGNSDSHPTERAAMYVDIQTAVAASGGAQAHAYSTDGWIVVADDTIDSIHPDTGGFVKIANEMLALLTPPSSGGGGRGMGSSRGHRLLRP